MADDDDSNSTTGPLMPAKISPISTLRASVRPSHPEIDRLYSDAYIASVLSVPNRTYEYARDEKILRALEWRRSYDVDALVDAFRHHEEDAGEGGAGAGAGGGGVFRLVDNVHGKNSSNQRFRPSQRLVDVCQSGAFCIDGFDEEGRVILRSHTARLDWWKMGVDDGIRYHVLVIEHALGVISKRNNNNKNGDGDDNDDVEASAIPESMVLYVDTSNLGFVPLPLGALTGMAKLLQIAYPDRIHRIHIGPVNAMLMKLYEFVSPYLRPRSRDKIVLMERAPEKEAQGTGHSGGRGCEKN